MMCNQELLIFWDSSVKFKFIKKVFMSLRDTKSSDNSKKPIKCYNLVGFLLYLALKGC
ncbi:MAG: Uncharacterised protein [SAR92 bacterium MED-G29]|jgi:hypothetical protein|nr:MAG: Uncharacterised protein [SAR92 bacterium MED-G29]